MFGAARFTCLFIYFISIPNSKAGLARASNSPVESFSGACDGNVAWDCAVVGAVSKPTACLGVAGPLAIPVLVPVACLGFLVWGRAGACRLSWFPLITVQCAHSCSYTHPHRGHAPENAHFWVVLLLKRTQKLKKGPRTAQYKITPQKQNPVKWLRRNLTPRY